MRNFGNCNRCSETLEYGSHVKTCQQPYPDNLLCMKCYDEVYQPWVKQAQMPL